MPLFIDIKVNPSSGKQKIFSDKSGVIKCCLKSAPEKGKANYELIKFLAKKLSTKKEYIQIVSGLTSRKKRIKIDLDINLKTFFNKMGIEKQASII